MYPRERKEWRVLLNPNDQTKISCYPLQMKISKLKTEVSDGNVVMDEVIAIFQKPQSSEGSGLENIFVPITFGEIGYNLLNQTLTTLVIDDA